jgi:WD40-like Beta Propeller Repeat
MRKIFGMAACAVLLSYGTAFGQQFGPWSAPVSLGQTVNSQCDDQHPALSKDGLSLVFASTRPQDPALPGCDPGLHLWVSQRESLDSPWQTPQPLTVLNTPDSSSFTDYSPNFSADGHWLFFHSSRADSSCNGGGRLELMAAHRQDARNDFGWEPPINLGCVLNTSAADNAGPTFLEDDSTGTLYLYFTRNETPANPNGFNIYVSTCTADISSCNRHQLWSPGTYVAELNSAGFRNTRTAIRRRDGLEMLITSNRPGTVGALDLWVSLRDSAQDPWSIPIDLNVENLNKGGTAVVNTTANDGAPALSWDGQTVIFYSNKAGGLGGNDLYTSTRQKPNDSH